MFGFKQNTIEEAGLITVSHPESVAAGHYMTLFSKMDALCRKDKKKIIAVTSSIKGEGKTTTVSNLSVVAARNFGKRSLIIDGDFHNPSLAIRFNMKEGSGLLDVIAGKSRLEKTIHKTSVENLAFLQMGNAFGSMKRSSIWASKEISVIIKELREWFDYIWIDAPPILPLFDMHVIANSADGILIVVQAGETSATLLPEALKSLSSKKIIGSVLNRAKVTWPSKYYKYTY